jgi:uncharacterized alkaline shock family protein YloU
MADQHRERPRPTVGRRVIAGLAAAAAADVPGVARVSRGDGFLVRWLAGPAVRTELHDGQVDVEVRILARPGIALPDLAGRVRHAVASAVERQGGLRVGEITAIVDGVRD